MPPFLQVLVYTLVLIVVRRVMSDTPTCFFLKPSFQSAWGIMVNVMALPRRTTPAHLGNFSWSGPLVRRSDLLAGFLGRRLRGSCLSKILVADDVEN